MSENQHKQSKVSKLLFRKTELNEPIGLVSQPVQPVEEKPQIWLESSLKNKKLTKKKNSALFSARMSENQLKQTVVFSKTWAIQQKLLNRLPRLSMKISSNG